MNVALHSLIHTNYNFEAMARPILWLSVTLLALSTYITMARNCSTWCRSLLLTFRTRYLGILGLERAINCILA